MKGYTIDEQLCFALGRLIRYAKMDDTTWPFLNRGHISVTDGQFVYRTPKRILEFMDDRFQPVMFPEEHPMHDSYHFIMNALRGLENKNEK